MAFDRATFEAFVGEKVSADVLRVIQNNCGDNIERAVNLYLDGTWKRFKKAPPLSGSASRHSEPQAMSIDPPARPSGQSSMPEFRYIGALGVEGWATRSGANLLKHGDVIKIERQKIQPVKPGARGALAAAKRVDVIVRFTTASGAEVGRLAKDTANWVSTLIDQKICKFEGTCVFAPETLRTNDTIFIQLRCSMLRSAFHSRAFKLDDDRKTGVFEQAETSEEKALRLRQVALVRLFQEINLQASRGNAAAAKHHQQGLLDAAEHAEKKEGSQPKQGDKDKGSASPCQSDENEEGEELEQDQLDALYKKAQSFDFNTPEAEPADTFAMTLRPYQKQSLYWMMAKEKDAPSKDGQSSMHPLWEEYTWPTQDHDDKELPLVADQPCFYVNPYSGDLSLQFPVQEQHCLGGILADEMGLGKTIQMLSLWHSETENASKEGTMRSLVYYGSDKNVDLRALCCEANAANAPDVIITSYGIVLSEFSHMATKTTGDRSTSHGLFSLNFFRVILDEAHSIKNRQSKTARACYELAAEHRWVLTGTPIVNRLEDLFSLVKFLRVEPWSNFSFWRTFITVPFESQNFVRALDVVQTVLEPLVMRRTKDMKTPDGKLLVPLPSKHIEFVDVELSPPERAVYDHILARAKRTFSHNVEAGTVMKAYTTIFAQILRLRQSVCHPLLVRNQDVVAEEEEASAAADIAAGLADDMDLQSLIERFTATTTDDADGPNRFGANVLKQIRDEASHECPICTEEPMIEQTVTGCWHSACKECLTAYVQHQSDRHEVPRCFNCREPINARDLFEVVRHDDVSDSDSGLESPATKPRISLQRLGANHSSAKIVTLMAHLRALRRSAPRTKSVVFSQFTSFLSLLEPALARADVRFLRLDGSMAHKARAAVLADFAAAPRFTVLLISLKAGGVGLNLTSAQRVYMMDPWWSFAVEAQAIDRVHRMGQEHEVRVFRFIVRDSVEQRMLRVQERKKFIATSLGMMSDEEKKMQRIEDIKELLS
ncbi:hypothetical protein P8C59_002768 [Phyllachora maydis]|uniref:DNA repair protein rad5 n=1 Tax=Phyllachora maydis TaxID=1825666 RepID=A0AAD9HYV4_9PEZI|nr:hypothetical protein P8C59_002768 [Phyllachora maydis]